MGYPKSRNWTWIVRAGIVATIACFALPSVSQASLIVPDLPEFCIEADTDASMGSSNGSPNSHSEDTPNQEGQRRFTVNNVILGSHGLTNGMTTSSSTSPSQSNSSVALTGHVAILLADPSLTGWIYVAQHVAIPLPPANSLLRPPQV
jgi:hypothetical protein